MHVDQLHSDPAYRAALDECHLDCVESILSRTDGRIAAWSRSTDTTHIRTGGDGPGFYLKRYYYPTWRKRLRTMLRGTFFGMHRGQAEYRALSAMRALGIGAVRPVAYGARRVGHFVTACFLISEEVPEACNLTTFAQEIASGRRRVSHVQRRALIEGLAAQVAHMHGQGFSHGQLFWRNILVRYGPDGGPEFFFLDAQPRRWRQFASGPWWQRELAHLAVSAIPFTTRAERLRFLRSYANVARLTPAVKAQLREIDQAAQTWLRHETQRVKMNALFDEWNQQLTREGWHVSDAGGPARQRTGRPV